MRKFEDGDRVKFLDKSCGQVIGLDQMLYKRWRGKMPVPSSGTVTNYIANHESFGAMYSVEVDNYDESIHTFRVYSFREYDLVMEDDWDISEDLFEL